MPSITVSTANYNRAKATRDGHKLTSLDKAIGHAQDDHAATHVAPPVSTLPYRVILVVPKDMYDGQLVNTDYGSFTVQQGVDWLRDSWCRRFNEWLAPSGYALNFDVLSIVSKYTITEMRAPGTQTKEFSWSFTPNFVAAEHPTLVADKASGKYRHMFVAIGGEGFAGGACVFPGDRGYGIIGDWELGRLTGTQHPTGSNADKDGRSWSHELLHTLGAYCHAGNDFSVGEFAVAGSFPAIDSRFTSFPITDWGGAPIDLTNEHYLGETRLYAGAVAQMLKFSGPWMRKL